MVLAILIFFIIIVLLVVDIRAKVVIYYDFDNNIGKISLSIFGIKFYQAQFSLVGDYINFVNNNKKVIQIRILDIDAKTIKIVEDITKSFTKRINPLLISTDIYVSNQNAFGVSMLYGVIQTVLGIMFANIISNNEHLSLRHNVCADYLSNNILVSCEGVFVINLYDLLWSVVRSLYLRSFGINGKKESSQ